MTQANWSVDGSLGRVIDLGDDDAIPWLVERYGGLGGNKALTTVLAKAFEVKARCTIIEHRYVDADWRSEYQAFYASSFRRYPSMTHRLHFFEAEVPHQWPDRFQPDRLRNMGYLGYCVLRPLSAAPVGRTFLAAADPAVITCTTTETVHLYGERLRVRGTPFLSQDGQLNRCAQTCAWMTAYYHHLASRGPRILPQDIAVPLDDAQEFGRPRPSPGITRRQFVAAATAIGRPPLVYSLRKRRDTESIPKILCRYLNSGIPVTILTGSHAFVLVGYEHTVTIDGEDRIVFIRQDDEYGPYQRAANWDMDQADDGSKYGLWRHAIVPLEPKIYVPGGHAEGIGREWIAERLEQSGPEAATLSHRLTNNDPDLKLRTCIVSSNDYKRTLRFRKYPRDIRTRLQLLALPRLVWVVELTDRKALMAGLPCVLSEVLIDATEHPKQDGFLALRTPRELLVLAPDEEKYLVHAPRNVSPPTVSVVRPWPVAWN